MTMAVPIVHKRSANGTIPAHRQGNLPSRQLSRARTSKSAAVGSGACRQALGKGARSVGMMWSRCLMKAPSAMTPYSAEMASRPMVPGTAN